MILPWREVPVGGATISTSLTAAEADTLCRLAAGRRVLEIGSAYGYSAIRMAETAVSVLAVDPHHTHNSLQVMRANLDRHASENVSILLAESQHALPMLRSLGARFDVIFIDGDHSEQTVRHDVLHALELLDARGTLACHDYGEDSCPGVKAALDKIGSADQIVDTLWVRR